MTQLQTQPENEDGKSRKGKRGRLSPHAAEFLLLVLAGCVGCFAIGLLTGYFYSTGGKGLAAISGLGDGPAWGQGRGRAGEGEEAWRSLEAKDARNASTLSWLGNREVGKVCSDTCAKAKDGVCDDGRGATNEKRAEVHCDLGTDCTDCGAWEGDRLHAWGDSFKEPIAFAKSQKATVFVKKTRTRPPFFMAYTDPKKDLDVSDLIDRSGIVESGITRIFWEVLRERCVAADGSRRLVLDVGANFGYYALYAASMGCRVVLWEPVPLFRAFIYYNAQLNGLTHLLSVRAAVASDVVGDIPLSVPTAGVWGTASVGGMNQQASQRPVTIQVAGERLDDLIKEPVLLLKVDVEGHEPQVFSGAANLLRVAGVEHIVLEYNPGVAEGGPTQLMVGARWEDHNKAETLLASNPRMLMQLLAAGYRIGQMNDNIAKGADLAIYDHPPFKLPEVTMYQLKYDMRDAQLQAANLLGCPIPPQLESLNRMMWGSCNSMPDDAHPKSLRSMFPYNTNLWAARNATLQAPYMSGQKVGIFDEREATASTWFVTKLEGLGVGQRACPYLEPYMMVRSRCRCKWLTHLPENKDKWAKQALEKCAREEALVERLVKEGKMPFTDSLKALPKPS